MDYFVSTTGNNANAGTTLTTPYGTIQHAVDQLQPGDRLRIRKGIYIEQILIRPCKSLIIEPYKGESVLIDGAVNGRSPDGTLLFRTVGNGDWDQVGTTDEYTSKFALPAGIAQGSFANRRNHTRLITYDNPADLRAKNQKFGHMPELPNVPPGPLARHPKYSELPRRPWVYMGPGIYQDPDTHKIHIRLTHTNHAQAGVTNYTRTIDPRQVELAICTDAKPAVKILNCEGIVLRGLRIRGGGGPALSISHCTNTWVDHVSVLGGPDALLVHDASIDTTLTRCLIDGGLPPWMFRSDLKDDYKIDEPGVSDEDAETNRLGKLTVDSLLRCGSDIDGLILDHCEFVNGHDLKLAGTNVDLVDSWIDNVNDDALIIGEDAHSIRIHHCAIERVLTLLNLVADSPPGGSVSLYRNLIDLRRPTRGRRPHPRPDVLIPIQPTPADPDPQDFDDLDITVMRLGQFFKAENNRDPDLAIFHNTVLVVNPMGVATYPYFFRYDGVSSRRVLNNILVSINDSPESDRFIAFLPRPRDNAISDGNLYRRIGRTTAQPFAHKEYTKPAGCEGNRFDGLTTGPAPVRPSCYFEDTKVTYPPGVEAMGVEDDPRFRVMHSWPPDPRIPQIDDFGLTSSSPARDQGAALPDDLRALDPTPSDGLRDIGCVEVGAPPLAVGVDGRRRFPPPPPVVAPV